MTLMAFVWMSSLALADGPAATPPASGGVAAVTSQAVAASSGDPRIDALLDRLEAKGQAIKGLSTKFEYIDKRIDPVPDVVTKRGELLFARRDPNPVFLITFREMTAGGVKMTHREDYLFDGQWLTERVDRAKTITRRQIARENERIDPFQIERGPFPLPFGQRRSTMLGNFTITLAPPAADDPPHSDHLHCIPRPGTELAQRYSRMDMYVDRKLDLPTRIEVERVSDENVIDVRFSDLNPNDAPAQSRFQLEKVDEAGWDLRVEPLPDRPAEPPAPRG